MEPSGHFEAGWEPVRDAFAANFDQGKEVGGSVFVTVDGAPVVDLWGGEAEQGGAPWAEDTIVNVYSTTKTMAALCVLMLADRGEVDLDAPVASYWPEFAQAGKEGVLVRHVMSHSAGLSGFEQPVNAEQLYDWDAITGQLAAQSPWWEPGTKSGYHAVTQGYLQGEIVRRATGRSIGTFFREEVATPLGADFHIGLDPAHDARVGRLVPPGAPPAAVGGTPDSIGARTMTSCKIDGSEPATTGWRRAEIPAAGGIGNARSVGTVHAALANEGEANGVQLLSAAGCERILEEQTNGPDLVLIIPLRFGMGFGLKSDLMPIGPNQRVCFWGGWGGSIAWIDMDARMTVSYVMNKMEANLLGDQRGTGLVMAAYEALGA